MNIKSIICTAAGGVGAVLGALLGGWSKDLITLMAFMAIDLVTGIIVAAVFKKSTKTESGALSSKVTYKGVLKKICQLFFVVMAHLLDRFLGMHILRSGVIVGFIINELVSIVENAALMGIVSETIESALDLLKKEVKK